jgi:hypothetical protein
MISPSFREAVCDLGESLFMDYIQSGISLSVGVGFDKLTYSVSALILVPNRLKRAKSAELAVSRVTRA